MDEVGLAATSPLEWYEALKLLYLDREKCSKYGCNGRLVIENNFSRTIITKKLAEIFKSFV